MGQGGSHYVDVGQLPWEENDLAGVEVILNMRDQLEAMRQRVDELVEERQALARRRSRSRRYALEKFEGGPPVASSDKT